ncbi:MAG TPA: hydroxyacid dehydrogenase [Acidimicrobiia bacterium]
MTLDPGDGPPPRARVVVPEFLPDEHLGILGRRVEVTYDPDLYADRPRLLAELGDARAILIRNRTRIDAELLGAAPDLEVVGRLGVGLDNIDLAAASEAGVRVIPAYGANAVSVAEYVMAAMLILTRGIFSMTESMVAGQWPRQGHAFGRELQGKTLGLVGFGSIARQVAARASGFGMRVIAHDPYLPEDDEGWSGADRTGLDDLLVTADVISIHIPLTDETSGLISEAAMNRMKAGAVLINTSRGGIVDEIALADALRSGAIAGAALDVFATEPLEPGPASVFAGLGNLILTPHVAGNTDESVDRVARTIVDAVLDALAV